MALLFLGRVAPALDQVAGSFGSMGTAVGKAVANLADLIAVAEGGQAVWGLWLQRHMTANL